MFIFFWKMNRGSKKPYNIANATITFEVIMVNWPATSGKVAIRNNQYGRNFSLEKKSWRKYLSQPLMAGF